MQHLYRWNEWNLDHIGEHGVDAAEAEDVVDGAMRPWPEPIGDGKWRVWGQTAEGRYLQVIYIFDPPPIVFVVHARALGDREKRQYRRRRR